MEEKKQEPYSFEKHRRLSRWLDSTARPEWMGSEGIALIGILIARGADDHPITDSTLVLAAKCKCSYNWMFEVIAKCEANKWVTVTRRKGNSNRIQLTEAYLKFLRIPSPITPDAAALAKWYIETQLKYWQVLGLKKHALRDINRKSYPERQGINAARVLQKCENLEHAKQVCRFAIITDKYRNQGTAVSLYNINRRCLTNKAFASEFEASDIGKQFRQQQQETQVAPQSIRFPKPSFNRSKFSKPEDVLHVDCCDGKRLPGWGVLESRLSDLRASAESGDNRTFTLYPKHEPETTCYAHSELWCSSPTSEDAKPTDSVKEKLRIKLARILKVKIPSTV
jgi:hypothetical protein